MVWRPWQVWLSLAWGLLALVVTVLFLTGVVPEGVILATLIISGAFVGVTALLDHRARRKSCTRIRTMVKARICRRLCTR